VERIEMKKLLALVLVLVVTGLPLSAADTAGIPMLFYGEASWYGDVYHGRTTASGETYDMTMLTAAHRTLPFGTLVRVTNLENDKSVTVRINDRGPFAKERVIDVSRAAASLLDFRTKGTAKVEIRVVQLGDGKMQAATTAASAVPALTRNEDTRNSAVTVASNANQNPVYPADQGTNGGAVETPRGTGTTLTDGPRIIRPEDVQHKNDDNATVKPVETGKIVIQAGAFLSLDNAESLLRSLQAMGLPVFIRQFSGERLHRVWVGPFAAKADADQVLEKVRSKAEQAFIRNRN